MNRDIRDRCCELTMIFLVAVCLDPGQARAQSKGSGFSIGLYAATAVSPFGAAASDNALIPAFDYTRGRFSIGTSGLGFDVVSTDQITLTAKLAPRTFADPTSVPGLGHLDRDIALEAGVAAELRYGRISTGIEALTDVSDTHRGTAVRASVGTAFTPAPRWGIALEAGATWMDGNLATYSFGVLPSEARGTLAAYSVQNLVVPSIGVRSNYELTDRLALVAGVSVDFLPRQATDSLIVKRDTLTSAMIGLRFEY
ncbi:MipA/OmpV family protein [Phaeobacter sp. HF9A]|uniref:MipA/OmpV family protein n=1 Tax=Phaeobacter sp. HF9A TaxID=2721561 RepID=UPI00143194FF|nr:MipA/OmpV family protein [Phaeobacter sp. HF9A]NIZ12508.1 MipA/OmpV family protein [Phaeobacter sp. HF9A]